MSTNLDPDAMPSWIATLWPRSELPERIVAGVNEDDCGVVRLHEEILVVSTDFLNSRPIAIELGLGSWFEYGTLVVAANLSDLCGSGAAPRALLVAAMMRRDAATSDFKELMRGVHSEAAKWNVPVIGGDTKLGDSLAILGVAVGAARSESGLFLKSRARPGDLLWVSGEIGSCSAAVVGLSLGVMSDDWEQWAARSILVPSLPLEKSHLLSDAALGHGGTDLSDGLGADILSLCLVSGVGVVVEVERLPIDSRVGEIANVLKLPPWAFAFGCGGDFQFVVTTDRAAAGEVERMGYYMIGEITAETETLVRLPNGSVSRMPQGGHRDGRRMSFAHEVLDLVRRASELEHRNS